MRSAPAALVLGLLLSAAPGAHAACPVGLKLSVDNDTAGSGYSEVKPENWVSHNVDACKGTYRYLSAYVGDGTRKGKAIWQPKITTAGMYEVTTGYRASTNRTNDADYTLFDDLGGSQKMSVDQTKGSGCTKAVIGTAYCSVGGSCRLVLDGDDGKSDAADETTFVLKSCDASDAGSGGPCDGIKAIASYELCTETPTTCAGLFNDASGCTAYCAAAGMICTARFGAAPGCVKEANAPIPCGANNAHGSDWCECTLPAGSGGATGSGGTSTGGTTAAGGEAGFPATAGSGGASAGAGGSGGGWTGTGSTVAKVDAGPNTKGGTTADDGGGCGCRTRPRSPERWGIALLALIAGLTRTRRRCPRPSH